MSEIRQACPSSVAPDYLSPMQINEIRTTLETMQTQVPTMKENLQKYEEFVAKKNADIMDEFYVVELKNRTRRENLTNETTHATKIDNKGKAEPLQFNGESPPWYESRGDILKTFKTKNNKRRTCYMCSKANTQGICIECAATEAGSASKRCAQFGPTKDRKKADEHILAHRERAMGIERPLSDRALAKMYNEKLPGSRGIWQGATGPQAAQAQVETAQM